MWKQICIAIAVATLLCACGSKTSDPDGVQDLTPGQTSVIRPPAATNQAPSSVQEKDI